MTQRREVLSQPKPSAFTISENAMIRVESLKRLTGLALATTMLAGAPVAQAADTRTALQAAAASQTPVPLTAASMASAATPMASLADPQVRGNGPWARAQRKAQNPSANRRSEPRSQPRPTRRADTPRASRSERPDRTAMRSNPSPNRSQASPWRAPQANNPAVNAPARGNGDRNRSYADRERNRSYADRGDSYGNRNRDRDQRDGRNWNRDQRDGRHWDGDRDRDRERDRDRYRDDRRDNDRWRNDGRRYGDNRWRNDYRDQRRDHRRWDRSWRGNNRYDWYRYRSSNRNLYRAGAYYVPYRNWSYRRISVGFTLGSLFYGSRYWINDPWRYRLPEVYGPYRWVRYYDDVLLVDMYSGQVVDVIYDFFW